MGVRMKKICSKGHLYDGDRCGECNKTSSRGYGSDWRRLSERFRIENPLCADCEAKGLVRPSQEVHHIKPLEKFPHLRLVWSNLVALCSRCHQDRHESGQLSKQHDYRSDDQLD